MDYYKHLYLGESIKGKQKKIIKKLNAGKPVMQLYLITLAKGEQNHLEFYKSLLLQQKAISSEDIFVVGLAGSYEEALILIEKITKEVYDATKSVDIRSYICMRHQDSSKK